LGSLADGAFTDGHRLLLRSTVFDPKALRDSNSLATSHEQHVTQSGALPELAKLAEQAGDHYGRSDV
jgi:hypothetical protein